MKNSKSKRILFIMFFPVVFVLIMLTIGLPQQLLTAATVGTEKFKVTDFNFYYYEAYYSFVNENYNRLGDIGLNIEKSSSPSSMTKITAGAITSATKRWTICRSIRS